MKDLYNKIEDYLTGELSATERTAFEQAMAADADLAAEVRLHQKMASVFKDPQAFQLRKELQQAGNSFQWPEEKDTSKPNNIRYLYWISAIAAILAGVLFFFLSPTPVTEDPITNQISPPSIDTALTSPNTEELAQENVVEQNQEEVQEPDQNQPSTLPKPPVNTPVTVEPPIDLLAANPALEELITNFEPGMEYDFGLDVQIIQADPESQFLLQGEVYTAELPSDGVFHLAVYDNQAENYPEKPVISTILYPTQAEEDQPIAFAAKEAYGLLFVEDLPVYPAKYYYVISAKGMEQAIAVGVVE